MLVGNGYKNDEILEAGLSIVSGDCAPVAWALSRMLQFYNAAELAKMRQVADALREIWRKDCMDDFDEVPAVKAVFNMTDGVVTPASVRPPLVALNEPMGTLPDIRAAWRKSLRDAFESIGPAPHLPA